MHQQPSRSAHTAPTQSLSFSKASLSRPTDQLSPLFSPSISRFSSSFLSSFHRCPPGLCPFSVPAMAHIQIWGCRGFASTDRALFTAAELGVPVDFHPIDWTVGQHKKEDYLKQRHPFGKVPAAEVDGLSFYESRAICCVIARSTPAGERLFPMTDLKRVAMFEQWASLELGCITPILEKIVAERIFKPVYHNTPTDAAVAKRALEDGQAGFRVMDTQLSGQQYVTGQEFSLIDIYLSTYFNFFVGTEEGKQTLQQWPHIAAWWQRIAGRPAWLKMLADREQK